MGRISGIAVLRRRHACIAFEVFSEEWDIREIQGISDFLNGHFGGTEFGLRVVDDERRDDVCQCFSRYCLDGCTEMLGRQVHLFGIEWDVSLCLVILYNHSHQFFGNFLIAVIPYLSDVLVFFIYVAQEHDDLCVRQTNLLLWRIFFFFVLFLDQLFVLIMN